MKQETIVIGGQEFPTKCPENTLPGHSTLFNDARRHKTMKATHIISAVYFPEKEEVELTWKDIDTGEEAMLTTKVSPSFGEKIAEVVPACVYWRASLRPAKRNDNERIASF